MKGEAQLRPRRPWWRRWLPFVLGVLAVVVGWNGGSWVADRHAPPVDVARWTVAALSTGDPELIEPQIDTNSGLDRPRVARALARNFRGWWPDPRTIRIVHAADDGGYTMGFTAQRDGRGPVTRFRGSLASQPSRLSRQRWRLSDLWIDDGSKRPESLTSDPR